MARPALTEALSVSLDWVGLEGPVFTSWTVDFREVYCCSLIGGEVVVARSVCVGTACNRCCSLMGRRGHHEGEQRLG